MKEGLFILLILLLLACNKQARNPESLQSRVDSLEIKTPADYYVPGFGDFMSSIQVHHNKLWFAGQNQNWKLADFEVHEIMEAITDIQKFQTGREESKKVTVILPALDSVNAAIQQKSLTQFKSSYTLLTNTCNNCHRETEFEFNIVKIPDSPPFSNQEFSPQE